MCQIDENKRSYSDQYLSKYPQEFHTIMALGYAFGSKEVDEIAKKAIEENKKIITKIDSERLDYIEYKLIDAK